LLIRSSQGIDFRFLFFVIQFGVCATLAELYQRGGRGGRDDAIIALFLIMYEGWVEDLDVMDVPPEELEDDPDRPFLTGSKKNMTKRERVGIAFINCIQSIECLRCIFAGYLSDKTPEGGCLIALFERLL
jgi:superfamily II DNA helicase RecQ